MTSSEADIIFTGVGPAGVLATLRSAELGARTMLVARAEFGGMAANDGPVQVRTLAQAARLIRDARQLGQYSIAVSEPVLGYSREPMRSRGPGKIVITLIPPTVYEAEPPPVVPLSFVVPLTMRDGPSAGAELIDAINDVAGYHLIDAARDGSWPAFRASARVATVTDLYCGQVGSRTQLAAREGSTPRESSEKRWYHRGKSGRGRVV